MGEEVAGSVKRVHVQKENWEVTRGLKDALSLADGLTSTSEGPLLEVREGRSREGG